MLFGLAFSIVAIMASASPEAMLRHAEQQLVDGALATQLLARDLAAVPAGCQAQRRGKRLVELRCPTLAGLRAAQRQQWFLKQAALTTWLEYDAVESEEEAPADVIDVLWHLQNAGQTVDGSEGHVGKDLELDTAWSLRAEGQGVLVGVVDSGLYAGHRDLAAAMWANPDEDCTNGVDDDGNGYVDDCWGWDFGEDDGDPDPRTLPATKSSGATCIKWHGSFIGGLIAGQPGGGRPFGAAPQAKLINLKKHTDDACSSTTGRSIEATAYALDKGVDVLTLSFNTTVHSQIFEDLLLEAEAAGVFILMSAGNSGADADERVRYPNQFPLAHGLVIASSDNTDALGAGSNHGAESVDLAAPGVDLTSVGLDDDDADLRKTGTSYAVGTAAAAAAVVWSAYPDVSLSALSSSLMDGATAVAELDCSTTTRCVRGGGRVSVAGALEEARTESTSTAVQWLNPDTAVQSDDGTQAELVLALHNPTPDDVAEVHLLVDGVSAVVELDLPSGARRTLETVVDKSSCSRTLQVEVGDDVLGELAFATACADAGVALDAGSASSDDAGAEDGGRTPSLEPTSPGCAHARVSSERGRDWAALALLIAVWRRRRRG